MRLRPSSAQVALLALLLATAVAIALPESECTIKGNINRDGEAIYHVPGGRWYGKTQVNIFKGEKWFCTESEAEAAGWRRPGGNER